MSVLTPLHTLIEEHLLSLFAEQTTTAEEPKDAVCIYLSIYATMSNKISSLRQSRNKLHITNLFLIGRKDEISFDSVAKTGNIVAKKGNSVEARFDFVERIVQLMWHSTVLLRRCCWCGRGAMQRRLNFQCSQCNSKNHYVLRN